jgi:hypothetical protein
MPSTALLKPKSLSPIKILLSIRCVFIVDRMRHLRFDPRKLPRKSPENTS